MTYTHLTPEERYQIHALQSAGHCQAHIALHLNRSPSTISREMVRNRGHRGYRPKQANELAQARRAACCNARMVSHETWQLPTTLVRRIPAPDS